MSDLHDLMQSAATGAPTSQGLLAAAHRSARTAQRRRVSYAAVGTAGVVAAAAAGTSLLGSTAPAHSLAGVAGAAASGAPSPSVPAPSASVYLPRPLGLALPKPWRRCEPETKVVPTGSVAAQIGLLSSDQTNHLVGAVTAGDVVNDCSPAVPLAYEHVVNGLVTQTLTVTGPIPDPAGVSVVPSASAAPSDSPQQAGQPIAVRGTTGRLTVLEQGAAMLTWLEPGGGGWSILSSGLTTSALVTVADGLTLSGAVSAAPSSLPPGMVQLPGAEAGSAAARQTWVAHYEVDGKDMLMVVIAGPPAATGWALAGDHVLQVRGHQGDASVDGSTHSLTWAERPDLLVGLAGVGLTDAQVAQFAASLTTVSADDPRLQ